MRGASNRGQGHEIRNRHESESDGGSVALDREQENRTWGARKTSASLGSSGAPRGLTRIDLHVRPRVSITKSGDIPVRTHIEECAADRSSERASGHDAYL